MKCRLSPLATAILLVFGLPSHTLAQQPGNGAFQAFTKSQFYAGLINRQLAALPPEVFQRCPSLESGGSQVTVLAPITFAADGFPNGGIWKQTFPVTGCGNDTVLNFYFQATPAEKINAVIAAPGDTHANLTLQQDASRYAKIGVETIRKDCPTLSIKTTKFEGYGIKDPPVADPGVNVAKRPWWESWTMAGCGHTYIVPLDFMPDATGTRIVQPNGVIEK